MAGFKFSLQTLLSLKEQFEKSAKNELGLAMKALEEEKAKLASIDAGISHFTEEYRAAASGSIQPEKIKEIKAYLETLYADRERQKAVIKRKQEMVDKIREKVVSIMKERKILENLKEKELERYKKQEEQKEQKRTDELVSYKESVKKKDNSS
jgi:flagellar FliJ protein